ncbi:MAG: LacI family DNA-binding transcriptional regulator [Chthoniobacteraceae bacterium]
MSDEPKPVTMQMIADRAGVSRMAVSLALRNSPKVSAATRQRIHDIAAELGYRPNPLVSALMTQLRDARRVPRPTTLAFVTAYPTEEGWRRPGPFVEFYEGAKARAEALGYTLEEWWAARPGMSERRLSEILFNRNIHGLLVAPLPAGVASIGLDWAKFAAATIGLSLIEPAIPRASNDQYHSITLALQELTQLGYRRIGLAITDEEDVRVQRKWSAGFLVYQQGIPVKQRVPSLRASGALSAVFPDWFRKHRPEVVVSQEPRCIEYLARLGVSVPGDSGFAHLALTDSDKDIAGINQNGRLVGASVIDLVDAQLRRNERGVPADPRTVLVQGRWVPGPTVRAVGP